ncbi:Odorant receptor [Camponotus japonicus]
MNISRSSGYKDFVWAVELHRLGLELIGLWPNCKTDEATKKGHGSDIRVGLAFITVILVSGVPLIWALLRVWGDMVLMIDNLRITLPLIVVSIKFVIMRWKRTVLLSIINTMAEDWTTLKLAAEKDVMIKRARTARLLVIFGYIIMMLAFVMLIILPCFGIQIRHITNLTDRNKPLPLQTYYFYDTDQSLQFELTFLAQAITISLAGIIYTSVDAFLGLVILHICGQLENFRRRVINLVSCKDFNNALSNTVVTHLRLIRFADNIEDTFTLMMLGLLFYFGIVFCLCGFLLLTVVTDKKVNNAGLPQACYMAVAALILLSHTFLYCGAGELITQHCNAVYRAVCDLEWYKLESRKARNLIILMIRIHEPFRITAGKIVPLTMTTFCSLLKTSAGYISFLLAKRS